MRSRSPLLALALPLLAAASAGCTVHGSGKAAMPAWKTYVDEHPVTAVPFTLRSGTVEVRVRSVVVEEHHTAFGKSSWVNVVNADLVNLGAGPLLWQDVTGDFRIRTRSGADTRGSVLMAGKGGWRRQEHTKQPDQLPSGAAGGLRVQAEPPAAGVRDDPTAISFRGQTVKLR
jgi:hypothetical protein